MRDDERTPSSDEIESQDPIPSSAAEADPGDSPRPNPSLTDELATLIDDGRTYAEAELGFQKTRASLAGRKIGAAVGLVVLAVLLVHLVLVALVIGLLIALTPPLGIWGSMAVVIGGLLILVGIVLWQAKNSGSAAAKLFKEDKP